MQFNQSLLRLWSKSAQNKEEMGYSTQYVIYNDCRPQHVGHNNHK